jgi:hypothetical protein
MERFVAHGYRGTELHHLHLCRMHLNALRVSDICTSDGKHITDSAMEVQKDLHRSSSYTWPQTERPEYKFRALWRTALAKVLMRDAESQALLIPLDYLSFEPSVTWLWTYSPSKQRLFKPENDGWVFFHVVSGRRHSVNRH